MNQIIRYVFWTKFKDAGDWAWISLEENSLEQAKETRAYYKNRNCLVTEIKRISVKVLP